MTQGYCLEWRKGEGTYEESLAVTLEGYHNNEGILENYFKITRCFVGEFCISIFANGCNDEVRGGFLGEQCFIEFLTAWEKFPKKASFLEKLALKQKIADHLNIIRPRIFYSSKKISLLETERLGDKITVNVGIVDRVFWINKYVTNTVDIGNIVFSSDTYDVLESNIKPHEVEWVKLP